MVRSEDMTVTVINPATEETIATLESAGVDETDAAVAAARAAFPAWRAVSSTMCTNISPSVTSAYGLVGI